MERFIGKITKCYNSKNYKFKIQYGEIYRTRQATQ